MEGERWPVIRTGERAEIPPHVRTAIWFRDNGRCVECHHSFSVKGQPWHLDHIKPWSAGGSDDSTNLRILCERHNMERSNFIDGAQPKRPVTWWCINCFSPDLWSGWLWVNGVPYECPTHGQFCNVVSWHRRFAETHGRYPEPWHERDAIEGLIGGTIAYCAHCDAPGLTAYPL